MVAQRLMTEDEKFRTRLQAIDLSNAGREAEAKALENTIPMEPWVAAFFKKYLSLGDLLSLNANLAEVELAYGKEWLIK
ncbi:MAG: hypothetical protein LBN27_04655 [Prevotellaceae bacterium]|nr:hypothetical protein [Prevotellaceae bacterium]